MTHTVIAYFHIVSLKIHGDKWLWFYDIDQICQAVIMTVVKHELLFHTLNRTIFLLWANCVHDLAVKIQASYLTSSPQHGNVLRSLKHHPIYCSKTSFNKNQCLKYINEVITFLKYARKRFLCVWWNHRWTSQAWQPP